MDHVVNDWVVTAPGRQGEVVGPKRRGVCLHHGGRDVQSTVVEAFEEFKGGFVILEEARQGTEDCPGLLLNVIGVVVHRVVNGLRG